MARNDDTGTAVHIRKATRKDWQAVALLLAELGRPDIRLSPDGDAAGRQIFERYLRRRDAVALVAEQAGRILGFVDMEYRSWLNFKAPQAWIPDMIVAEGARGRGIGGALLRHAEELARSRNCWSMALESANWREAAHEFYGAHGWTLTASHFTKSLTDVDWPPAPGTSSGATSSGKACSRSSGAESAR
jgi:GNAT superfamily N-acetyltransferase